jgi:peptidoglycan/LPS O-acetylase OafA/YrhL
LGTARLASVDVLRAIAALSVLVYHVIYLGPWPDFPRGLGSWFHHGWIGVDLFLLISGYATSRVLLRANNDHGAGAAKSYWLVRATRIFPLYWFSSFIFLLLIDNSAINGPDKIFQILTHVFLLHGWFPSAASSINGVTWTLTLELMLYLFGFWLLWRQKRNFLRIGAALFFGIWLYRAAVHYYSLANLQIHYLTLPFGACDGFFLGLCIAVMENRGSAWLHNSTSLGRASFLIFSLVWLFSFMWILENYHDAYWQIWVFPIFFRSGLALAFALILIAVLRYEHTATPVDFKQFWAWRVLSKFGLWSYGIYLWHPMVIQLLRSEISDPLALLISVLGLTTLAGCLSYYCLELPMLRWAKNVRFADNRQKYGQL